MSFHLESPVTFDEQSCCYIKENSEQIFKTCERIAVFIEKFFIDKTDLKIFNEQSLQFCGSEFEN